MTSPVSLWQPMTGAMVAPPFVASLSDDELRLVRGLAMRLSTQSTDVRSRWAYYDGLQRFQNLGISIPPQLSGVRTVVDWPRICVDPLVQRCVLDGFRIPGATDVDSEFAAHVQANDLDAELPLGFLDALVTGRGYAIVGSPDAPGDSPLVTVESPLNMAVTWDPRSRSITAAYQAFEVEGIFRAVLYLPNETISMSHEANGSTNWTVDDRDVHNFGEVPVVRLVNRSRTSDREGRSEITAAVMNTTDSACRALLGMEIARELYSIPRLALLGAQESDFVDGAGRPRSAVDMAMTKILALERDEAGDVPQIVQLTAFDPSVFTKIVDEHAQLMASYTGFPPQFFGQTTTANPASADAIRVAHDGLDRRSQQLHGQFSGPVRRLGQLIWRFAHDGAELPDEIRRLEVDWVDASIQTPAATTDALQKQAAMGAVPSTSDVVLKRLGWSAVERLQLAQDRATDEATQLEAELTNSIAARQARSANSIAADLEKAANPVVAVTPPPTT